MSNKPNKKLTPKDVPVKPPVTKTEPKKEQEIKQKFSVNVKLCFMLGLISLIVYANTLKNGFVYDDESVITKNTYVNKGISEIPQILSTPYRRGFYIISNDLYRPLSLVMFAIEYQFFGRNPIPYHCFNILLFIGCVILLFLFLDKLFERKKTAVAFIASLLFALHPIHTEVVANIKSLDELLCFFFVFLSLNVFIKYILSGRVFQLLLGAFCFFLSLLSKESVITFLVVIPLIFFFYRNEKKMRSVYITFGTTLSIIIYLIIRFSVLEHYHANEITSVNFIDNALAKPGLSYGSRIATSILILGYYIKLLFAPYPLICDYSYNSIPFVHFGNIAVLFSLFIYIFLLVFSIKRFLNNHKDPYAFGVLFFLITISLFTNIPFLIGTTMGERLLFFPSVGFCLLIALLIERLYGKSVETWPSILKQPKVFGIIIPVCLVFAIISINRNSEWIDNYTLYSTDIKNAPNNSKLNYYLGLELQKNIANNEKDHTKQKQIREAAISYISRSLAIYPDFADAQSELGKVFFSISQFDSAEVHDKRALQLNSKQNYAINDLAEVYLVKKKYKDAIKLYREATDLNPNDEDAEIGIGNAFYYSLQYDSAEIHQKQAIKLNPKNTTAINNLAGIYFVRKNYVEAIELYKKAIEILPNYVDPYTNIGVCYLYLGKYDSAVYSLNKAISIDPGYNKSYENIAITYKAMGNLDSAKKYGAIAQKNNLGFKL